MKTTFCVPCEQARGEVSNGRRRNQSSLVVSCDQRKGVNRYCKRASGIVNCGGKAELASMVDTSGIGTPIENIVALKADVR